MKRALFLIIVAFAAILSSCGVSKSSTTAEPTKTISLSRHSSRTDGLYSKNYVQFVLGKTVYVSNAFIIQTIDPHFGIAATPTGVIFAVSTSDSFDPIYDDLKVSGAFVMIKTYTYETAEDEYGRTRIKTIPQVVPLRDYQEKTIRVSE